ncbi:hypothetical protein BH09MYX1_BH09MYX1_28910 [soil metagenome]
MYGQYPPPYGPPGFGSPYAPVNPIGGVKTGAMLIAGTLVGLIALDLSSRFTSFVHVGGYSIFQMYFWLRMCSLIVMMVGLVMMARLPRAFGVQLSAWSGFAFFLVALLYSIYSHVSGSYFLGGADKISWFIHTVGYGCLPPLVMVTASQTGLRFGAATNAIVGTLVGVWRIGLLFFTLIANDDPYGYSTSPYDPQVTSVLELLLFLPAVGSLATLFFLLRQIPEQPMFGVAPPPMAPYPGGYPPPPPPWGGYGPPGPPPPY